MPQNLITLMQERQSSFSKGQRRIAAYITEHYDQAAFMTAHRLGDTVGVSESTVVRFAADLGYEGYPAMQKAMQSLNRSRLTSVQRIRVTRSHMKDGSVLGAVIGCDVANIRQTLEALCRDTFERAVDMVTDARRVYIFGAGSCRALAMFTAYYLKMLLVDVELVYTNSETEIFQDLLHIDERDVMIGISFPRYSTKSVKALHFAHTKGAGVIAITDSDASPIAPYASCLLTAHSDMATIVDSLVAPLSIINALVVAISLKKEAEIAEQLMELERLWEENHVYQKIVD